jgi:Uma2 family endonuclease
MITQNLLSQPNLEMLLEADELGLRLEVTGGLTTWELSPMKSHQKVVDRIRASIKATLETCECVHYADVFVRFQDGSLKRPDISVFCSEPIEENTPITLLPKAVIEVISKGYEAKDLELNPPFYLGQGVLDVLVLEPATNEVWHFRKDLEQANKYVSPVTLTLECGCEITV